MHKKRILFGAVDIGHRMETYSDYLKKNYAEKFIPESASKTVLPQFQYRSDYTYNIDCSKYPKLIQWFVHFCFFVYALLRYDIFHFFSGETLLTRYLRKWELKVYKVLNKKVIMHFVGADIRSVEYIYWKSDHIFAYLNEGLDKKKTEDWQDDLISDVECYANYILVSTPDLLELVPNALYYPVVVDSRKLINEYNLLSNQRPSNVIRILHAPSNIRMKGTKIINSVLREIEREFAGEVELILTSEKNYRAHGVYTINQPDLFELYKEVHILIDQIVIGWYGLQSIEALIAGCSVVCFVEDKLEKYLYPDCPINNTNVNNLKDDLKILVRKYLNGYKVNQSDNINWVSKYHSIDMNNNVLNSVWN